MLAPTAPAATAAADWLLLPAWSHNAVVAKEEKDQEEDQASPSESQVPVQIVFSDEWPSPKGVFVSAERVRQKQRAGTSTAVLANLVLSKDQIQVVLMCDP